MEIGIVLVIVGLIIVVVSFFLSSKTTKQEEKEEKEKIQNSEIKLEWTEKEINHIKEKINSLVEEQKEEVIFKVEEKLASISNEKIMAVSEFSDQILNKINENHTEVVFLYNMLSDKEDELKHLLVQVEKTRQHVVTDSLNNIKIEQKPLIKDNLGVNESNLEDEAFKHQASALLKANNILRGDSKQEQLEDNKENHNSKILELYKSGKSIVEISKMLDIGQGEVNLVIGLFQESKR